MKRSSFLCSLAVLCAVPFIGACKKTETGGAKDGKLTIAFLPKSKGNQYFVTCERGARAAAKELGAELLFDGPTNSDPAKQNEIVEGWISSGVDVIAAACENKEGLSTALRNAQKAGIKVVTYDADALPDARSFFVNQATEKGIGDALLDNAAKLIGEEGEFAIITANLTAANQNAWIKAIETRQAEKYPKLKLVDIKPCDDLKDKAQQETTNLLGAHPNLKAVISVCSPGVPGAAEAVKQAGKTGAVKVVGLGLPSENKAYVKEGVTQSVILWKVEDLGYLAIKAGAALADGSLKPGATEFDAGKLGKLKVEGDNILLGTPFAFTKENIDQFDF
ncbi:substrate-binding domain-containing protein [Haloferula sp. BvORR071]|uniref:autoinducer 2 ABC transporter substrate-binding protein n=1 Tax=Haloferula sp. BvORR071 TaxID=1396141 RepID=UPI000556F9E7|nr:substrate-binding domain-containing protein [Haloferula sp. BvORR071]